MQKKENNKDPKTVGDAVKATQKKSMLRMHSVSTVLRGMLIFTALATGGHTSESSVDKMPLFSVSGIEYNKNSLEAQALPAGSVLEYAGLFGDKPWGHKVLTDAIGRDPEAAFRYATKYVKYLEPDLARQLLIDSAKQGDAAVEQYASYKALPYSQDILMACINHNRSNPGLLLKYANVYRSLPDAEQIFADAVSNAQTYNQTHLILRYAENFKGFENSENLIREIAIREVRNGQYGSFMSDMPNYANHPWVHDLAVEVANNDPLMFLSHAEKISDFPDANPIMQQIFGKFTQSSSYISHNYDMLIDFFPKYKKYANAEELLERSFGMALELKGERSILSNAHTFAAQGWTSEYIKKAAENDSQGAVMYFENYNAIPGSEQIFKKAVESAVDIGYISDVLKHSIDILQFKWGQQYLALAADKNPAAAIAYYADYSASDIAEEVLKKSVAECVRTNSGVVIDNVAEFADRGWAVDYIKQAALENPNETLKSASASKFYAQNKLYLPIVKQAAEKASPLSVLMYLADCPGIGDKNWISRLIENAANEDPYVALSLYVKYKSFHNSQEWFMRAAARVAESEPSKILDLDVYENILGLAHGKELLQRAARNAEGLDTSILLWRFWIWDILPEKQKLVETSVLGNPEQAIAVLEQKNTEQGMKLHELISRSQSPNVRALLKINFDSTDGDYWDMHRKSAILLVNNPYLPYDNAISIVKDNDQFLKALMDLRFRPDAFGGESIDRFLSDAALRKVNVLNDLHEKPDSIRFESVNNSSARELYTLIVYGEQEAYTSTYDGLFSRLMVQLKKEHESPRGFFEELGYANFRNFIKLASQYNRMNLFFDGADPSFREYILKKFVEGIDKESTKNMLPQAVAVADAFAVINDPEILRILQKTIKTEYTRVSSANGRQAKAIYGLLAGMLGGKAVIDEEWLSDISKQYSLPNIVEIPDSKLFNSDNINVQEYFFYPDDDGKASFANFLAQYRNKRVWTIEDKIKYVHIISHGQPRTIEIFANKPEGGEDGIVEIEKSFDERKVNATVVVHRGHSYYANITISHIPKTAKVVSLGSCGGYNNVAAVLERAPDASILSTKGKGKMSINDQLYEMLNEQMLLGNGIDWPEFWAKARTRFRNDQDFNDYTPPYENMSMLFFKAYNNIMSK